MSETLDLSGFKKLLPKDVTLFLEFVYKSGYLLTLVGGAVRDYVLYRKLSGDLDFEVRSLSYVDDSDWEKEFQKISHTIGRYPNTKVELLKFNIMRVKFGSVELEISSPRIEIYNNSQTSYGHSDFDVKFSNQFSYEQSFARRDFSINAMGIEFSEELKFIDPFHGLEAISNRELNYITDDFFKDPVRLLRTLRFKVAHDLKLGRKLKDDLVYFNLDKLSLHYFKQEGKKIGLEKLIFEMDFARRKFALKLPPWAKLFHLVESETFKRCDELLEVLMNFSIQQGVSEESILELGRDFLIKKTIVKSLCALKDLYLINLSVIKKDISNIEFEEALELDVFVRICRLYKSSQKISDDILQFYLSKEVISFLHSSIESVSNNEKSTHTLTHDEISMLGIYCHIIKNY